MNYGQITNFPTNQPIVLNPGVQLGNTRMCPSASNGRNHVAKHVALGDCPINVGNDQFVTPTYQIDVATAPSSALQFRGNAKACIV